VSFQTGNVKLLNIFNETPNKNIHIHIRSIKYTYMQYEMYVCSLPYLSLGLDNEVTKHMTKTLSL